MPGDGKARGLFLAGGDVAIGLGPAERTRGLGQRVICIATRGSGPGDLGRRSFERLAQKAVGARGAIGPCVGAFEFLFQGFETVQLLQAQRCCRGRVPGAGPEPVPAPQVAFDGNQPLSGEEVGLKRGAIGAVHEPHLRQPPRQNGRNGNIVGDRRDTGRQGLRIGIAGQGGPSGFLVAVDGGSAKIVGQCRTQRLLIAGLDRQKVHHLTAFGVIAVDEFGERRHLGIERLDLALGGGVLGTGLGLARLCLFPGFVGGEERRLRL